MILNSASCIDSFSHFSKCCYFLFRCTQPKVTNFSFITLQSRKLREKLHVFREGSSFNLFSLNQLTENSNTNTYLHFTRICHMTFFLQTSELSASEIYKLHYLKIRKFSSDKQEVIGRSEG